VDVKVVMNRWMNYMGMFGKACKYNCEKLILKLVKSDKCDIKLKKIKKKKLYKKKKKFVLLWIFLFEW
jgi:hypothetical protein